VQNPQVQLEQAVHQAIESGSAIDAAYTLEPTGTVGEMKGITRVLENGVVSKYVLEPTALVWDGCPKFIEHIRKQRRPTSKLIATLSKTFATIQMKCAST